METFRIVAPHALVIAVGYTVVLDLMPLAAGGPTTDITEFDCVSIGDYSELNAFACPQTHRYEDRVMKIDHVEIGSKVTMGPRSAVLYSAKVGDNARLGPLTLVMKGEHIPKGTSWAGCPAAPARP
ncbi:hypothetical protein [Massilia pseudoviolaceinigra]|uniref:hypothetical protein n=1 Tax=Massilia pseudoviolaceinigra TaxID=3057165 RepID=UPI002796DE25|nr:hypothetical protein [Massilia sp. CCM 9206]MDQ1923523.1 hypothetical protein [Massilia sp. CCM 9206]